MSRCCWLRETQRDNESSACAWPLAADTRIFLQLFAESFLLVATGAALGWLFAIWATGALARWPLLDRSLAPNTTVLLFTLGISVVVALIFGLVPFRSAMRVPIGLALKTSSATSYQDRKSHRSAQLVVALQMSMCLVLLVGAGLLVRTLHNLETLNLGLRPSGLLVFGLTPQQQIHNDAEGIGFFQALIARIRALPGVESATLMRQRLGVGWSSNTSVYVDGQKPKVSDGSRMRWNSVGSDFFHTLAVPIPRARHQRCRYFRSSQGRGCEADLR